MNEPKQNSINVDVGLAAKAEVKAEIPPESSGRLVDALTDIIRPFSERRGLIADQLRLQREDVAMEIARKAQERLHIDRKEPTALPLKTVVPILEKGSLEDPSDEYMIEKWAALLASGSYPKKIQPRYVSILGELSASQIRTLALIAQHNAEQWDHPYKQFGDCFIEYGSAYIKDTVSESFRLSAKNDGNILENLFLYLSGPGRFVRYAHLEINGKWDETYIDDHHEGYDLSNMEIDIEILKSLSLLDSFDGSIDIPYEDGNRYTLSLHLSYITHLGIDFIEICDPQIRKNLKRMGEVECVSP